MPSLRRQRLAAQLEDNNSVTLQHLGPYAATAKRGGGAKQRRPTLCLREQSRQTRPLKFVPLKSVPLAASQCSIVQLQPLHH